MALWRWKGMEWKEENWNSLFLRGTVIICGSGHSLHEYAECPRESLHICINSAYKFIRPDIWIGLDEPEHFGMDLLNRPFRKIFRGGMQERKVDDIPVKEHPETYFMDLAQAPLSRIFTDRGDGVTFVWRRNSFISAVQLAIWMGFRHIGFAGVDFSGEHCDGVDLSKEQKDRNEALWKEMNSDLKSIHYTASNMGIRMFSLSPKSVINQYMNFLN